MLPSGLTTWPEPNTTNPTTRGITIYIVNSIWLFLATTAVTLRLYTRIYVRNWFGLDDAFISIALLSAFGVAACVFLGYYEFSWDRHIWDLTLDDLPSAGKILFASKILWAFASSSVRFSITCLYYRLLKHTGLEKYRWVLHLNLVFMIIVFLEQTTTSILACIPTRALWTWPLLKDAKCLNSEAATLAGACLNTISEFIVATLPIPVLFNLRLAPRQRWAVASLLSLGFFVTIIGCVRTYFVYMSLASSDPSWWAGPHWICSEVEIDTALICACAPALRPFLGRIITLGPSAANRPALNESTRRVGDVESKDETTQTSTSSSNANEKAERQNSAISPLQTFDLEGIANDGFGYVVSVTTGLRPKSLLSSSKRWGLVSRRSKIIQCSPKTLAGVIPESEQGTADSKISSASMSAPKKRSRKEFDEADGDVEILGIKVMTKTTVEIRESFHEPDGRGWDVRNPYREAVYDCDVEAAIERSAAQLQDWSLCEDDGVNDALGSQDAGRSELDSQGWALAEIVIADLQPRRSSVNDGDQCRGFVHGEG